MQRSHQCITIVVKNYIFTIKMKILGTIHVIDAEMT